jgi:hypothetical protein
MNIIFIDDAFDIRINFRLLMSLLDRLIESVNYSFEFRSIKGDLVKACMVIPCGYAFVLFIGIGVNLFHSFECHLVEFFIGIPLCFFIKIPQFLHVKI